MNLTIAAQFDWYEVTGSTLLMPSTEKGIWDVKLVVGIGVVRCPQMERQIERDKE